MFGHTCRVNVLVIIIIIIIIIVIIITIIKRCNCVNWEIHCRLVKRNSIMLFRIKSWQIWKDLVAVRFGELLKDTGTRRRRRVAGGSRPIQWLSLYLEELSSEIISACLIGRQSAALSLPARTQPSDWSTRKFEALWLVDEGEERNGSWCLFVGIDRA